MTLTLLIDLDDTLLSNPMETFIPAYLGALSGPFGKFADASKLDLAMKTGTTEMFRNNRPDRSLKEAFDQVFYPLLGISEKDVRGLIDHFYLEEFSKLSSVTQLRPEAIQLIDAATQRGWRIAIATNPVFPLPAILHRLSWAGLPDDKYHFAIVPSYETFHFAKPNPAYFAELLGRFGWPRGEVVMVGNDPEQDIKAAQLMGIPTFWITNGNPYPDGLNTPNGSGGLEDVIPWIESAPDEGLIPDYVSRSAITGTLSGIPSALLELTADLPQKTWTLRPNVDEWSLTEIMCHLRDVEREINLPRLRKMISETNPFIPGVDSDIWAVGRDYQSQNGHAALRDFVTVRMETLDLVTSLSPNDWQRPVQHAIFGPTSLCEIARIMAGHDRLHIRQTNSLI